MLVIKCIVGTVLVLMVVALWVAIKGEAANDKYDRMV